MASQYRRCYPYRHLRLRRTVKTILGVGRPRPTTKQRMTVSSIGQRICYLVCSMGRTARVQHMAVPFGGELARGKPLQLGQTPTRHAFSSGFSSKCYPSCFLSCRTIASSMPRYPPCSRTNLCVKFTHKRSLMIGETQTSSWLTVRLNSPLCYPL